MPRSDFWQILFDNCHSKTNFREILEDIVANSGVEYNEEKLKSLYKKPKKDDKEETIGIKKMRLHILIEDNETKRMYRGLSPVIYDLKEPENAHFEIDDEIFRGTKSNKHLVLLKKQIKGNFKVHLEDQPRQPIDAVYDKHNLVHFNLNYNVGH